MPTAGSTIPSRVMALGWLAILMVVGSALGGELRTYDGRHAIDRIAMTAVYFVPKDRTPLPDWRERVDYYVRRIEAFHARELGPEARLEISVRPEPLVSEHDTAFFRTGDQDVTFFKTMDEARGRLGWPGERGEAYPILLVLSDINWRELDDFRRTRQVDGRPVHEGAIAGNGRHFPGAESGGARATYIADQGLGLGLVSADGWRVPYSGSDCVVYHEGVGHPIGLPHPEPVDNTVMGTAQYEYWINQTRLNTEQKQRLGWVPPASGGDPKPSDLFSAFTAIAAPDVPRPGEPVRLNLAWPAGAKVAALRLRIQTALDGPWVDVPLPPSAPDAGAAGSIPLGTFDRPTPVSYRVDATLADGQIAEIWGYFQVK